jgi:hypothetical protein
MDIIMMVRPVKVKIRFSVLKEFRFLKTDCLDPCLNRTCGPGVCTKKANTTFDTICSCPLNRKGDSCELPKGIFINVIDNRLKNFVNI